MIPTKDPNLDEIYILVGSPVMLKAVRLFLEALRREYQSAQFSKYMVLCGGNLVDLSVDSPQYATAARFLWDLSPFPQMGTILDLMQKPLLQSLILATYCVMTVLWMQARQGPFPIV